MNAQLEIVFSEDSTMLMLLKDALLEEYPDGYTLHAADSDIDLSISKKDIIECNSDEDMDEFKLQTQGNPITVRLLWEDWTEDGSGV